MSGFQSFWDFWAPIIFTLAIYIGIRNYIGEARYIPSGSMLPGLKVQDRLFIEKITLRGRAPSRGEIVVFNSPYSFDPVLSASRAFSPLKCALLNFPLLTLVPGLSDASCDAYIKRVVAVAGDQVFVNYKGEVIIDGKRESEPYVSRYCSANSYSMNGCRPLLGKVPEGHVLVLGDNRGNSWDGRFWPGGNFLPVDQIIGRAVWRFWPLSRLGPLHGF
nr:signal peptidase I [Prochlorococcus sp. MIT 1341]